MKRVLILGGGVGGTLLANLLARRDAGHAAITLVNASPIHHYQPGWLYLPFRDHDGDETRYDLRKLLHPDVELVIGEVEGVDANDQRVHLENGARIGYDYLVIATGSQLDEESIPGLQEAAHHFYTEEATHRLREALHEFQGGRIVVGIAGFPLKCPPAPLEFTFLLDDWLRERGLRARTEIIFTTPIGQAFMIPAVAPLVEAQLERKQIGVETFFNLETVDPERRRLISIEGTELEYDLLVMIAPHKGADFVGCSGLGDGGNWVPTDKETLQVIGHPNIFAIGDATDLPISKSGAAAHFEAEILADNLTAMLRGEQPSHRYDGSVMCFMEVGEQRATLLKFNYEHPPRPPAPSQLFHWMKAAFGRFYPLLMEGTSPAAIFHTLRGDYHA